MTIQLLQTTRIGVAVNSVRKHCSDEEVATSAKILIKNWKRLLGERCWGEAGTLLSPNPPWAITVPQAPDALWGCRGGISAELGRAGSCVSQSPLPSPARWCMDLLDFPRARFRSGMEQCKSVCAPAKG
uniref:TFIIS N-terminal domain-containing protein n=1 Tax=Strix occidentalis caurina TaxID=311401 RepID=A0A8D0EVM7_STROC